MIYLTTGLPGAGKTLWTLYYVKQLSERENRPVYYSGIPDLKLPWLELDKPEEWPKLPAGSIIVIDEAQRLYRPRGNGAPVPAYVQALETHRHHGFDLFIITQHPMLVEQNLRRLVSKHWHVLRTFGMQRATVHEFTELRTEPDKNRTGSIRHEWGYPKEVFNYYKSAEIHTHKRSVPVRVYALLAVPVVLGGLIWTATQKLDPSEMSQVKRINPTAATSETASGVTHQSPGNQPLTAAQYAAAYVPRIPDLPHTAPAYDQLNQPVEAPKPASCISSKRTGCKCYTQQATPLQVSDAMCMQIVHGGYFDATQSSQSASALARRHPSFESKQELTSPQEQVTPSAREGDGNSLPS